MKVISTVLLEPSGSNSGKSEIEKRRVEFVKVGKKEYLRLECFDGSVLGILEVRPAVV